MPQSKLNENKHIIQKPSKQFQVARLGHIAINTTDLQSFLDEVVNTIVRTLGMDLSKILELLPDGNFLLKAGYGFTYGKVGETIINGERNSQAGYTLQRHEAIVVKNLKKETRFIGPDFLLKNEVVSGMSVAIHTKSGIYGVLGVHSRREREFDRDDINFLQSISHIIGSTIDHYEIVTKIKESEEMYRQIIESAVNAIFITTQEGDYTIVNKKACELLGYTKEELLSMNLKDLLVEEELKTNPLKFKEVVEGEEKVIVRHLMHKSGEKILVEISGKALPNGTVLGIVRDLTQQKKLEDEMIRASKFDSIIHLAGGIAHDFNNLLSIILGNLTLVQTEIDPTMDTSIKNAISATNRAANLTRQLLTLAQEFPPSKTICDFKKLVTTTTELIFHGSKVVPIFKIPEDLWTIEADENQIGQVIQNLVINAKQATNEKGEIVLSAKNLPNFTTDLGEENYISFSVQDFGIGIPEENLLKIFDPFFTTKEKGTGLGLSTTYAILRNHNGLIDVKSTLGEGTTMTIFLPATGSTHIIGEEESLQTSKRKYSGRILVLDDEEMILETIRRILENSGLTVDTCIHGEEVIQKYKESEYDAVILDLTIPNGLGGLDTMKILQELDSEVKCIVSSGYSTDMTMENYQEYGFIGKINKPYTRNELLNELEKILD